MSELITLTVSGMKCGGCENNVSNKLKALDGVLDVNASQQQKTVTVNYDPAKLGVEDLEDAITEAGFTVE